MPGSGPYKIIFNPPQTEKIIKYILKTKYIYLAHNKETNKKLLNHYFIILQFTWT